MFSGFLTVLLLAGWQMSAERVFDKPVTGSAFYRPRQWSIHSPALVYSPVSLILSSTGAYLKTQETSDTIFDAAYVKCWEVSHIFGKHDRSLRAAIRARPVVEEVWCWRYHASFGVHAYFKSEMTASQLLGSQISYRKHFVRNNGSLIEICIFIQGKLQDSHKHILLRN